MDDVKIKIIDSDKLINAINAGSYDINLSAVMALGAVVLDTKKQESCEYCHDDFDKYVKSIEKIGEKPRTDRDAISRQAAIDDAWAVLSTYEGEYDTRSSYGVINDVVKRLTCLPSTQSEIIRCKDCKHIQKWRSEESAKKFGQIYECARNVLNCPKLEDFCSLAERRTDEADLCRCGDRCH